MSDVPDTFDLGLVMAGAISAGAYTAGVVDFLVEALDAWDKHRGEPGVPNHRVRIRAMTGASAGAMTSMVLTAAAKRAFEPVRKLGDEDAKNPFYAAWVREIDLVPLLACDDLDASDGLASALDCTVLDSIADRMIENVAKLPAASRPFIADEMDCFVTLSNLTGVPYSVRLGGGPSHGLMMHGDHLRFRLDPTGNCPADDCLPSVDMRDANWKRFTRAALASGAFPIGLRSRVLDRPLTDYADSTWSVPTDERERQTHNACSRPATIPPDFPASAAPRYHFVCVDGGMINNEPLELARKAILPPGQTRNPRDGRDAVRAVLMIDPFPEPPEYAVPSPETIKAGFLDVGSVVMRLFSSLKEQARFKPEELVLARDENVYSRFVIAPTRHTPEDDVAEHAIACGLLGGFGGFVDRRFRDHDYQLGRRNCQQFLRKHLLLPADNVFMQQHWRDGRDAWLQTDPETGQPMLPIIPLMPEVRDPIPIRGFNEWPVLTRQEWDRKRSTLEPLVLTRLTRLATRVTQSANLPKFVRTLAQVLLRLYRNAATRYILNTLEEAMIKRGQLDAAPKRPRRPAPMPVHGRL